MFTIKSISLATSLFFMSQLAGANEVRNGGSFLNCDGDLRLLDLHEAEAVWSLPQERLEKLFTSSDRISETATIGDAVVYASQILSRIESVDRVREANYQVTLFNLIDNSLLLDKSILPPIDDFGPVAIPETCQLLQAASQALPRFEGEKYFTFSASIWQKLAPIQKVALIVHEVVLFDELKRGERTSRSARYLTGLLFSSKITEIDETVYGELLSAANITPPLKLSSKMRNLSSIFSKLTGKVLNIKQDGTLRVLKNIYLGQNSVSLGIDLKNSSGSSGAIGSEKMFFFELDNQIYVRIETQRNAVEIPVQWVGTVSLSEFDSLISWEVKTTMPFNGSENCTVKLPDGGGC